MGKYHRNTGPVPSWAKYFNNHKNPGGFFRGFVPRIVEETKRENKKPVQQQNKTVDKTTNRKQLKCNRANDHLKGINHLKH